MPGEKKCQPPPEDRAALAGGAVPATHQQIALMSNSVPLVLRRIRRAGLSLVVLTGSQSLI